MLKVGIYKSILTLYFQKLHPQVKPIVMGIETLEETNEKLRDMVLAHSSNPNEDFGTLSMKLNGVLDAAVMGGISNYEKVCSLILFLRLVCE
jgi:hypothetical protein